MALSNGTDQAAPAKTKAAGKEAGRQRLAEALRANLARRKEQKRDRANRAGAATAQQEAVESEGRPSEPAVGGAITSAVSSQEDTPENESGRLR